MVLFLILSLMIAIQLPAVQTKVARYAVTELNKTFGTEINVERVAIDLFGDVNLFGVSTKDNHQLAFISVEKINAKLSLTGIIKNPNRISIKKLTLYKPEVKVITYKGEETSNFLDMIAKFSKSENEEKSDFKMQGAVEIVDGKLLIQNQNLEENSQTWVDSENFNTLIENFKLEGDEIWADLKWMEFDAVRNNENYKIKNFATNFHYSKNELRFDELNFESEDSSLDGHLVFSYETVEDLKDFVNKVKWDLTINEDSKVNLKDVRYFVESFDKNSSVQVMGKATGTLNDLTLNDFQLSGNGAFVAAKEFVLVDMTQGDEIILDTDAVKLKTSYQDLTSLLPTFIANRIPVFANRFGILDYTGDFHLNPNQIRLDGNAITALGAADMDVKLDDYKSNLKYSGSLIADNINIHQITEVKELGFVKGRMNFQGQGTDVKTLKITAVGDLDYLDLMDKRYSNLSVDGKLENQQFQGFLSVQDTQLNADYDGVFDFAQKPYKLAFTSSVKNVNLDYLGITKNQNAHLKADIKGDFQFSTIDDFLGEINLNNLHFTSKTDTVSIAEAYMVSSEKRGGQNLALDIPGFLRGEINGKYRLSQLPNVILNAVGSTALVTYQPKKIDVNQQFNFYFEVEQNLFGLFDPRIQIAPGSIVDGAINSNSNQLTAELSSSEIGFNGFEIYNPLINIDTSKEGEQIYLRTDSLSTKGVMLYNLDLHTTPINDSLMVKTKFQIGKEFPMDFDLNLYQTTNEKNDLVIGFSPSTINIDETDWYLNPNNDRATNRAIVNFDKNYYELQSLRLESDDQKLLLDGYYADNTDYKLNADLEQLILSKIIPKGLLGSIEIDGIANGNIDIIRTKDELKPLMELTVDSLSLNKYALGNLGINGTYNLNENVFDVELFLDQDQVQVLYANGYIDNKPEKPEINLAASLDDLNFKFLESFLSAAMTNIRGVVSGNVNFTGPIDSPNFNGMLDLKDLGFKVDYLNVDYSFDGVNTVPVSKESGSQGFIALDEVKFRDTRFNTEGTVSGSLLFRDFSKWFLNLSFITENLLVLNTNIKHNELFYGRVFGQGNFSMFGPPDKLDISATATINDNSEFTINTGATKIESENSLVRFIPNLNKEEDDDGTPKGMNIDLAIKANPNATVNLIIDPSTNDKVIARGSTERLLFNLSRSGNMSLNGTYTLESGEYQFRQVPLVNRDFSIKSGSYIRWDGNPFDADLNITANYSRTVSNVGEYLGVGYSQSYDVELGISITDNLQKPKFGFGLAIPGAGSDVQSAVDYKFNINPDEKMVQIASILLMGRFNTDTQSVLAAGATANGIGIAFKQLGAIINQLIGGVNFDFDYVTGSTVSNTSDRFKGGLNFNLSPRWSVNGAIGVPVGSKYANETTTGEAEIQWDVSDQMDKSLVINFFTRPTNFGVESFGGAGNYQSYGAGFIYKTSFDRLSEVFVKDKKEEEEKKEDETSPSLFHPYEEQDTLQNESQPVLEIEMQDTVIEKKRVSKSSPKRKTAGNGLVRFK